MKEVHGHIDVTNHRNVVFMVDSLVLSLARYAKKRHIFLHLKHYIPNLRTNTVEKAFLASVIHYWARSVTVIGLSSYPKVGMN